MANFLNNRRTRRALQAGAIIAAVGTGYAIRDLNVAAENAPASTTPPAQKAPVVSTPAIRDAASMQSAFADVATAVEPAVVTITNNGTKVQPASDSGGNGPQVQPFGGQGADPNSDDFQEFFKQFRKDFGFGQQNFDPNSWEGRVLKDKAQVKFREIQQQNRRGGGLGSGMIYRSDGLIITNAHVVRGVDTVDVTLSDGRVVKNAKVLGRDERTDIAVVKVDDNNLPTVKLGDSDDVRVGDWAIAVGNPFGLDHTLTVGVVSAKSRQLNLAVGGDTRTDYLQTDASINPGNSGGPLLDIYGRVIGVNNAIYSESGGNQGIGFAIPVNTARFIADRLVKDGRVRRSYLGVSIGTVERDGAAFGLDPDTKGVLINEITDKNGPGAKAGLQPGDVVVKFNGQTVAKSNELQQLVGNAPVGSTATITVLRNGKNVDLTAVLQELKDSKDANTAGDSTPGANKNSVQGGETISIPGLKVRAITPEVRRALNLNVDSGVVVTQVDADSAAEDAGLKRGDIIERVGQTPVSSLAELDKGVKAILGRQQGTDKKVALFISRGGEHAFVTVTVN